MSEDTSKFHYGAPSLGFEKAKENRQKLTEAEELLWSNLRNRKLSGYKFRRQHPIGIYIADFYCHEKKLVVELDGAHHLLPDEKKYDHTRTVNMNLNDVKVLRFGNQEVLADMCTVLEKIREELKK